MLIKLNRLIKDNANIKDNIKIKVDVFILNKSNNRIFLEKVKIVRKVNFGSRVIVNCKTNINLYFEIYLGAEFGKEIIKE